MLPVTVDDHDETSSRQRETGLDRGAVAARAAMLDDVGAGRSCGRRGAVRGAVVDDDQLEADVEADDAAAERADGREFIERGADDRR